MSFYNCFGRNGYGTNGCGTPSCSNGCGYRGNQGTPSCSCGSASNNYACGWSNGCRPNFPFPPQGAVCGTCPPGTRPCSCGGFGCGYYPPGYCGGGMGSCDNSGTYAFFNSTGSTLTTGSIIPLRYVIGSGQLGRGTTGGTVSLDSGIYSVEYSLDAAADTAGATVTVTPEYLGALHPEYSRSFTTTTEGQTFDIAGSFVVNLPTDTTLSLNVTITEPEGSTTTTTLTSVNASMLLRRISCCQG